MPLAGGGHLVEEGARRPVCWEEEALVSAGDRGGKAGLLQAAFKEDSQRGGISCATTVPAASARVTRDAKTFILKIWISANEVQEL